jgi:Xaa-Pro aminopeptidase
MAAVRRLGATQIKHSDAATARRDSLRNRLATSGADAMLVVSRENLRYLAGYSGGLLRPNGALLVGCQIDLLAVDPEHYRSEGQAEEETGGIEIAETKDLVAEALSRVRGVVWFEDAIVSVAELQRWKRLAPQCEFVPGEETLEVMRAVKDPTELATMRAACQLSDAVFSWLAETSLQGRTEIEVALALDRKLSQLGADGRAFDTRVLTGERSAQPHGMPEHVEITPNQTVLVDLGCIVEGYCSDCTRMFSVGRVSDEVRQVVELVSQAQARGLRAVRPGVAASSVDAQARSFLEERGLGDAFGHGLGHGVGLQIHEQPYLTAASEWTLEAGNTVTVEPGAYLAPDYGVRIEDLVLVTDEGAEVLTTFTKDLLQL